MGDDKSTKSMKSYDSVNKENLMRQGLDYTFKLQDLDKYSKKLRFKDINWQLKKTALGKALPNDVERNKQYERKIYLDKLLLILKNTDWSITPIYKHFQENNGRFQHKDDAIYSETELKYLHSSLSQMVT